MSSRQANQVSIRKDTQARLAELKGVALNTIPYPRSNAILTQYQEEIRNLENKANYQEIDSIDKLADWLAGPEKSYKPKKLDPVPTTMDEWVDKYLWLGKEDPVRHADNSITWFSRRIPELAPQKKSNDHGYEYWKLSIDANKPHITYEYASKIRNLMDDGEEYIIGIVNSWEMGRMETRIQFDDNDIPRSSKEE
ncbi:hypothetical protein Glove_329g16 [Diversispora epigaea]|uniref:Uncharacterized protein n=1 Tax=Diversispora epigaea TaxID=1348612 RepID=A0A397HQS2_9GLOM|nr:hypothetical protein Glove_329g16 [Diversispora epigaea]